MMMTAREWIEQTFDVSGDQMIASEMGDFQRYALPGINPNRMPVFSVSVDIGMFLTWFGPVIESALASGGSVYDALAAVPDRGWRPYFELWRAKGLIT